MITMESGETIVYGVAGGRDYVDRFDKGGWWQWPARAGG
jgi:hypothetical protein